MKPFKRIKKKKYSIPVLESILADDICYTQLQKEHPQDGRFKKNIKKKAKRIKEIVPCYTKDNTKEFVQEESSDTSIMVISRGLECDTGENKHKTESPDNANLPNAPVEEITALVHRNEAYTLVPCLVFDKMKMVTGCRSEFTREELPAMDLGIIPKHLNRMKIVIRADERNPKTAAFDAEEDCDIATTAVYENCIDIKDDFQDRSEVNSRTSSTNWDDECLASESDEIYMDAKLPCSSEDDDVQKPEYEVNSRTSSYESLALASDETYVKMPSHSGEDDLYFEKLGGISRNSWRNENLTLDADETFVKLPINSVEDGLLFQEVEHGVVSMMPSSNWLNEQLTSDAEETVVKLYGNSDENDLYNFEPKLTLSDTQEFQNLKAVNADDNILLNMSDDQQTVPKTTDSPSLYSTDENMVTSTAVSYNGNPASDFQGSIQEEKTFFKCVTNVDKNVKNKQLFYLATSFLFCKSNRNNFQHITKSGLQFMNQLKECTLSIGDTIDTIAVNIVTYSVQQHNMPLPPTAAGQVNENAIALPTPANIGQNQPVNQNSANRAEHHIRRQPIYRNAAQSTHQNLRVLTEERINSDLETYTEWSSHPFQPLDMVRAGLTFMGQNNTVVCRECGGRLYNFYANDDPREEHGFYFPYCPFMRDVCGDDYIDRLHPETEGTEQLRNIRVFFQTPEVQECLNKLILTDGVHAYPVAREAVEHLIDRGVTEHDIEAGTLWMEMQRVKLEGNGNVYTVDVQLPYTSRQNTASEVARGNVEQDRTQRSFVEVVKNHLQQTPDDMSIAGFSYTGQGDCVKCQECNGTMQNFCVNDDRYEEHVINYPDCPFANHAYRHEYINRVPTRSPDDYTPSWSLCIVCRANRANIMYLQCGHKICCEECSRDINICQQCGEIVVGKY